MTTSQCYTSGMIPNDRIKVFISSAMKDESGTSWLKIRRKIKDKLSCCQYINPFIIEDCCSETPSIQRFEFEVTRSDIVILIVKKELRYGVQRECSVIKKEKKALLAYFYSDGDAELDLNAIELKNSIIKLDYCTFKQFHDFDNLDVDIFNDIMQNIIFQYKYQHYLKSQNQDDAVHIIENINHSTTDSIIKQSTLKYFESCYGTIANEIGYGKSQEKHKLISLFDSFGAKFLKWIIYGNDFVSSDEINFFLDNLKPIYNNSQWIIYRWDAIRYYVLNNTEMALQYENNALESARSDNAPEWIISDILIDCRNLDLEINNPQRTIDYQQELSNRDELVYVPVLDRFVSNTYSNLLEEDIKLESVLVGTQYFGGNINNTLKNIENYIFVSLIYGSLTHLFLARIMLCKMLYKYGKIYKSSNLVFVSIKLMIVAGETKAFNDLLEKDWDKLYYLLSANAGILWSITDNCSKHKQLNVKMKLIQFLGLYLNDTHFSAVQSFLLKASNEIVLDESTNYLEAILNNLSRIQSELVVQSLINILKRNKLFMGDIISKILLNLDIVNIPDETLREFESVLEANLQTILQSNGTPQFIANLVKQKPDIFLKLEAALSEDTDSVQKSFYEINVGRSNNWGALVKSLINDARAQFNANANSGIIFGFSNNPYKTIQAIIKDHTDEGVIDTLINNFPLLAIDVFNSKAPSDMKENCMGCLIDVIIIFNHRNIPIEQALLSSIDSLQIESHTYPDFFTYSTPITSMYRWIMLKTVCGFDVTNEILTNYLSFVQQKDYERYILGQCINQYIYFCNKKEKEIKELFLLIIIEMSNDTYFLVRKEACHCLVNLLSTQFSDIAKQKLITLTTDSSPNVRGEILHIIKNKGISDSKFRTEIIECYQQDLNYAIRNEATNL